MSETGRRSLILPAVYAAVFMAAIILAAAVTLLLKQQDGPGQSAPRADAPAAVAPAAVAPAGVAPAAVAPAAPTEAVTVGAPPANATGDQGFLAAVRQNPTFTSYTDAELVNLGRQVCALYGSGAGLAQTAQLMPNLAMSDVAAFARDSVGAYCPGR